MLRKAVALTLLVLVASAVAWPAAACRPASPVGPVVLGARERVLLITPAREVEVVAKVDTGSDYSSIDESLLHTLGVTPDPSRTMTVINAEGKQLRPTVKLTIMLAGHRISTTMTVADRSGLSTMMLLGAEDLQGFLVDPSREFLTRPDKR